VTSNPSLLRIERLSTEPASEHVMPVQWRWASFLFANDASRPGLVDIIRPEDKQRGLITAVGRDYP
jgi:hypothetical protein